MKVARLGLGFVGIGLLLYGIFRLTTEIPPSSLIGVGIWLVAALIIHDGLVSPLVIGIGVLLRRFVPDRARSYLQFALITAALVSVIAIPLIIRRDSQPAVKAWLQAPYGQHLGVLLAVIGVATLLAYARRVARDHRRGLTSPSRRGG